MERKRNRKKKKTESRPRRNGKLYYFPLTACGCRTKVHIALNVDALNVTNATLLTFAVAKLICERKIQNEKKENKTTPKKNYNVLIMGLHR